MKITITRNGQAVDCFGKWCPETSNALAVFENEWLDGCYCDGAANWTAVVEELTAYAARKGTVLVELSAV
jgi:hypothetical protein